MTDREFLIWIHERLEIIHGDDRLADFMHHLRAIIFGLPKNQETIKTYPLNSLDDLQQALAGKDAFNSKLS